MAAPSSAGPRILHAPADVGGHAFGLSRAERELGLASDVAVLTSGKFGYEADFILGAGTEEPVWRRLARRAAFLARAARTYDVFHFNFGQSIFAVRQLGRVFDEISLLKRLGKTVLMTYQGCDVRPKAECPCRQPHCFRENRYRLLSARRVTGLADRVFYLNPDLRRWLPDARFMPYANVDPHRIQPASEPTGSEIVVVHAPTDVDVKGTAHVAEAVNELRGEGLPVRLDLVHGVSRDEVLDRCARAHLVVDQLLLGWYGGLSVEAMALGKPTLAYIRDEQPGDNPFGGDLAVIRTSPGSLADDLRPLVGDGERRRKAGAAGRVFVERHHDPRRIARDALGDIVPLLDG